VCRDKNATSSSKVLDDEDGGGDEGMVGFAAVLGAAGD